MIISKDALKYLRHRYKKRLRAKHNELTRLYAELGPRGFRDISSVLHRSYDREYYKIDWINKRLKGK
jgi:hypothetical protein